MNAKVLNTVQTMLIEFATKRGINLRDEFGTPDNFKTFVFSLCVKMLVDRGIAVSAAYDFLMGEGAYDDLAQKVWESANSN